MDFQLPELGEGVYEVELVEWQVKPGDVVKRGQELAEVVTDKASMSLPSPFFGTITKLQAEPGDMVRIGQAVLCYEPRQQIDGDEDGEEQQRKETKPVKRQAEKLSAAAPSSRPTASRGVSAAPSVRRMARKIGIDLADVRGSGPGGRVLFDDLTALSQPGETATGTKPTQPSADYGEPGTRRKLIGVRRKIAQHMTLSKRTIPHYSYIDECEITELVRLRASLKESYAAEGVKLTYLSFFVKAAVAALKEVPLVNASLDEDANEIVFHDRYDIGIATATPGGLLVPVIRDAEAKDLSEIAREIERLAREAQEGRAQREDLRGSTFTITSIGSIGGLISTPVINYPEAAILGIGRIVKRPVYSDPGDEDAGSDEGKLRPADMVYLSFSFDHRILDGAIGAVFGNAIIRQLQNPAAMLVSNPLK